MQVNIANLPSCGNIFPQLSDVRKEKVNTVKPYTQNKPPDTVIAQARRADDIIKRPNPESPPSGDMEFQKLLDLFILYSCLVFLSA
jgi:hypothetical protein